MFEQPTWAHLDEANKKDGHYHRFDSLKSLALRSAELALERANDDLALIEKLYGRGLATADDVIEAVRARALIFHLRSLLLDFWFIELQAKDRAIRAYQRGEISYPFDRVLARSAIETIE